MRVALHLCLWLPAALALRVPRRIVVLGPPAAALVAAQPHAAAAAAKKAATTTPTTRSAALDAAGYAYALVRASDGGAVVTLDLDRTQRVRSAIFFYETRGQADAVRKEKSQVLANFKFCRECRRGRHTEGIRKACEKQHYKF